MTFSVSIKIHVLQSRCNGCGTTAVFANQVSLSQYSFLRFGSFQNIVNSGNHWNTCSGIALCAELRMSVSNSACWRNGICLLVEHGTQCEPRKMPTKTRRKSKRAAVTLSHCRLRPRSSTFRNARTAHLATVAVNLATTRLVVGSKTQSVFLARNWGTQRKV